MKQAGDASGRCVSARSTSTGWLPIATSSSPRLLSFTAPAIRGGRIASSRLSTSHLSSRPATSSDAWEDTIASYVALQPRVTIGQVAKEALCIETARIGTADQRRIAAALERLGWQRERVDWQGKRWWSKR